MTDLALFLKNHARHQGGGATTHTNMSAGVSIVSREQGTVKVPGSFDIPSDHLQSFYEQWIAYLRECSIRADIKSKFTLSEKMSERFAVQLKDTHHTASNLFFDFDICCNSTKLENKLESSRSVKLKAPPPAGTVLEMISEKHGEGSIGICLGAVGSPDGSDEASGPSAPGTARILVILYPAFHIDHDPVIITEPIESFKRAGAYTVEEKSAFMCIIYTAIEDVLSAYIEAKDKTSIGIASSRSESNKALSSKALWFSKVGAKKKRMNFQIRMPNLCVPDPVRRLIYGRVSRMLNDIYPKNKTRTTARRVPSWCVRALQGIFDDMSDSSKRGTTILAEKVRELCSGGDEAGPLNPDWNAKGLRVVGARKKGNISKGYYGLTDVFVLFHHKKEQRVYNLIKAKMTAGREIVEKWTWKHHWKPKKFHWTPNKFQKEVCKEEESLKGIKDECGRIVATMMARFARFGGCAYEMKDLYNYGAPSTVSGGAPSTTIGSVVRSDVMWVSMMNQLCEDSDKAAEVLRTWSIFPVKRQLGICKECVYPQQVKAELNASVDRRGSKTRVWAHDRASLGCDPAIVERYVKTFKPKDWRGPAPYADVAIKTWYRPAPKEAKEPSRFIVNLDSTFCCRKMAALAKRSVAGGTRNGRHKSNTASLEFRSDGTIHATCFSQSGACALNKRHLFAQRLTSRWNEKDRGALGFSDRSASAVPGGSLVSNPKRKRKMQMMESGREAIPRQSESLKRSKCIGQKK